MLNGFKILTATHRNTPLQSIGKFVISHSNENELKNRLHALKAEFGLDELMYLATCNRVMFFFYREKPLTPDFSTKFLHYTQSFEPRPENDLQNAVNKLAARADLFEGEAAMDHLFKVAASVDSLVVGEREILRQLREAYERCLAWGLTGDHLRLAVQAAVVAAKEVYAQTRLGEKSVSVVSLAIKELLKTRLHKDARILMIGAGQTNLLVAKFLAKYGFQNVDVFNRSMDKAEQVAEVVGGQAFRLSELNDYRGGFDCLIACTGATNPIVDTQLYARLLQGDRRRKVVIDLSVPNNVSADLCDSFNLHLIEIENLKSLANENLAFREQEVANAIHLLDQRLAEFQTTASHRRIERALRQIPVEVKAVRERAFNEVFRKEIENLDDPTRLLLERMLTYMEKKCAGIPIKVAKEALSMPA